jgi:hypothetical protein
MELKEREIAILQNLKGAFLWRSGDESAVAGEVELRPNDMTVTADIQFTRWVAQSRALQ